MTTLIAWGVVLFALVPVQQHYLISVAPDEQNGVLSLNSSAVYVGQGLGAGLGPLTLGKLALEALGYAGALLAALTLIVLLLVGRLPRDHASADDPLMTGVKFARDGASATEIIGSDHMLLESDRVRNLVLSRHLVISPARSARVSGTVVTHQLCRLARVVITL